MPRPGRRDRSLLSTPYARPETDSELPRAVLVTGAHRSGTTLVGELLAQAAGTWTVWEPFNQFWGLGTATGPYPWIRPDEPDPLLDSLADYLARGW
ncbi:MAG: hypothetical protein QOE01_3146, partial [Actinomycetota bacterium]|nr:hypothetical protein [Actinomycetota bacterium]